MATKKSQIPASSGPGYKAPSPKPSNASTPLAKPVPGHSRGKDGKSK